MRCDRWDEHRTEHDGSTTPKKTHPNLDTAAYLSFKSHAQLQFPMTTWRQPRLQSTTFGSGATIPWMSRERKLTAKCSETTCTSELRRNLVWTSELRRNSVWTRHSACLGLKRCWDGTRDAGQAFEFAVPGDFEVNNVSQGAYSRASTDTRHDGCGAWCTATTLWDWEQMLGGTDSKSARGSS